MNVNVSVQRRLEKDFACRPSLRKTLPACHVIRKISRANSIMYL